MGLLTDLLGDGNATSSDVPDLIAGLICWVDADHFASTNGITARALADRSPYRSALTGTAGTFATSAFGTEPAIRFTGGGGYTSRLTSGAKPFTMFAVLSLSSMAAGPTIMGSTPAGTGFQVRVSAAGQIELLQQDVGGIGASTGSALTTATPYVVTVTYSSVGAWAMWVNGAASGSGITNVSPTAGSLMVAARDGAYNPFSGDLGAFLLYDNELSPTDIDAVEAYLAGRYGITV